MKLMKWISIVAVAVLFTEPVHSEQWYYAAFAAASNGCIPLKPGMSPMENLRAVFENGDFRILREGVLPNGERTTLIEQTSSKGINDYAFADTLKGCKALHDALQRDLGLSKSDSGWFIADGNSGRCIPMPDDLVQSMIKMWKDRGNQINTWTTESGSPSVTIFQNDNRISTSFKSEKDCMLWLPAAEHIADENRAR